MDDEEPADGGRARIGAAEEQRRDPGPDERDRQEQRVGDAQAGRREQVVGERVAGEAVGDDEEQAWSPR